MSDLSLGPKVCNFGSNLIQSYFSKLIFHIEGYHVEEDIEHIHQMRVSTRRLRSIIPLFNYCFPQNDNKWLLSIKVLTKALGPARDADVQILKVNELLKNLPERQYYSGIHRIRTRLKQKRDSLQPQVNASLIV
ncbi:MAG: CHAD domain-containing protein, partial [Anaerolineaceae bacterium]|nr:CHAD domain-containing protein [Anaerolineaceae bacterium]